jgi:transposase
MVDMELSVGRAVTPRRRRRSTEERRLIVEEALEPGASVARVARKHGVNANEVFGWKRLYETGRLGTPASGMTLLPVRVVGERAPAKELPAEVTPSDDPSGAEEPGSVIALPARTRIWIAAGVTDMRRGFHGLSAQVQTVLEQQPLSGHVFVFRGRRGDIVKVLWFDGDGLCLLAKRLERGRFVWPQASSGTVCLSRAQLSMLLEGIDWRAPLRTAEPVMSV